MKRYFAIAMFLGVMMASLSAVAGMTKDQRISDAKALIAIIENRYAPLGWKEEHLGISFKALTDELLGTADQDVSDIDFYAAMSRFLASLDDAHVRFTIPSSLSADLGIGVDYFDGEVIVTGFSGTEAYDKFQGQIAIGDRLVEIDGVPVEEEIANLGQYKGIGSDIAEMRIYAAWLTRRRQETVPYIPSGAARLKFERRSDGGIYEIVATWKIEGNELVTRKVDAKMSAGESDLDGLQELENPLDRMRNLVMADLNEILSAQEDYYSSPFGPNFTERIKSPFLTGTLDIGGHKIGYIRIQSWGGYGGELAVNEVRDEIALFEKETDALIIDQVNNDGGSLCFLEAVTQFFLDKPIDKMLFRIKANRRWLMPFESEQKYLKTTDPDGADYQVISKIVNSLRSSIENGETLTEPFPLCDTSNQLDLPKDKDGRPLASYTKPIIVLVNELDASAADLFPAIMQDSGRATIFGARTMGAGGNVVGIGPIGYSDFFMSVTESLMWRSKDVPDGKGGITRYIENVGVTPDIEYQVGLEDYLGAYEGYYRAVEDAVLSLIKG